ncbi:MAG: sulfatase [Myxococcota bacterium]|nr:sulfatase [Myxococcota bacterium]
MKNLACLMGLIVVAGVTCFCFVSAFSEDVSLGPPVGERERAVERAARAELPGGVQAPRGVVLVTVDTLRADHLGCYGHPQVLTTALDRLASGGQLFGNAISQSSTTTPSHASLMTGLHVQDHNVYSNFAALGDGAETLAETLADHGFATFGLVNMRHLNPEVGNLSQGINDFVRSSEVEGARQSVDSLLYWLDGIGERPFFAWLHLADVHTPYQPPAPYSRMYYEGDEGASGKRSLERVMPLLPRHMSDHPFLRKWLRGVTDLKWVMAQYKGAVTYVDDELGRLMGELSERGLLERTAMVVTSDHGENLGEHDMFFVHTGLYEQTVRVPLLTYFPGAGHQGVQINEVVELVDVLPTVLEYLELPPPVGIRGRSLWPLIRGDVSDERIALSEHAGKNLVALRSRRYKYIRHLKTKSLQPSYPFRRGREELYDLRSDPSELRNLIRERPAVLKQFQEELRARRGERLDLGVGDSELSAETIAVLKSLGYIR